MSLGKLQQEFTLAIAELIQWSYDNNYQLTFGDAFRDPRVHGSYGNKVGYSHRKSNHKRRLAVDFNLFKDGRYMTQSEDYTELGQYWESLHPKASWGGHFSDGNHFSFEYQGMK